jgi:tryptophanyl-tRNA synthetase
MRPTGRLHLGHLHGALYNWAKLQDDYECFYFIADWHALTSDYASPGNLKGHTREILADWVSVGLDPVRSTLFLQSEIKEHAELYLLLGMITPLSWLERNPTYKEQLAELSQKDLSTYGFLGYPVLQAADILMYKASGVPVGVDQAPHVELTREIARRFNYLYGEVFPEPATLLTESSKMPGLDGRKMSKSYDNAIFLSDPPEIMAEKVGQMLTDPARARRKDPGNPEVCTVFAYQKIYAPEGAIEALTVDCRQARIGCVDCKKHLAGHIGKVLAPIREKRQALLDQPGKVEEILKEGNQRARAVARGTMAEVREHIGI